ncbi:MAG: hypothetical protein ACSHXK_15530 [Oceanococcus sp.]
MQTLRSQSGSSSLYLALTALVVVGVGTAVYFLAQSKTAEEAAELPQEDQAVLNVEPAPFTAVDMQKTEIKVSDASRSKPEAASNGRAGDNLFERGGRKIALEDGLAGGSEVAAANSPSNPSDTRKVHALDAFDYGVLDGRVRIGVFGKGAIPDYRVKLNNTRYTIEMPGEFRYLDQFGKALVVEQFGVNRAMLERTSRGIRMHIEVTGGLKHKPFLIEDPKGLIIAFEPKD